MIVYDFIIPNGISTVLYVHVFITQNVYVSVGCQAQQTRYRIFMYETLFEDNLIATIDGSAPTGTFVLALQSSYIMDYSE